MSAIDHALPVVEFPDFPAIHSLGELRVAVIDLEHLGCWMGVMNPEAERLVQHSVCVLVLIGAFCFQERRPKAKRWPRRVSRPRPLFTRSEAAYIAGRASGRIA